MVYPAQAEGFGLYSPGQTLGHKGKAPSLSLVLRGPGGSWAGRRNWRREGVKGGLFTSNHAIIHPPGVQRGP